MKRVLLVFLAGIGAGLFAANAATVTSSVFIGGASSQISPEARQRAQRRIWIRRYQPVFEALSLPREKLEQLKTLMLAREAAEREPSRAGVAEATRKIQDLLGNDFLRWTDECRLAIVRGWLMGDLEAALMDASVEPLTKEQERALLQMGRAVEDQMREQKTDPVAWREAEVVKRAAALMSPAQHQVFAAEVEFRRLDRKALREAALAAGDPATRSQVIQRALAANPEYTPVQHHKIRLMVQKEYSPFWQRERLTTSDVETLRQLLIRERELLMAHAAAAPLAEGPHRIDAPEVVVLREQMKTLLGERFEALTTFERRRSGRTLVAAFATDLVGHGCPLSTEQTVALTELVSKLRDPALRVAMDVSGAAETNAPDALTKSEQEQLDGARAILTAEQQAVFAGLIRQEHAEVAFRRLRTTGTEKPASTPR